MKVAVQCPNCGKRYAVREEILGREANCKECETKFTMAVSEAPKTASGASVPQSSSSKEADSGATDQPLQTPKKSRRLPVARIAVGGGVLAALALIIVVVAMMLPGKGDPAQQSSEKTASAEKEEKDVQKQKDLPKQKDVQELKDNFENAEIRMLWCGQFNDVAAKHIKVKHTKASPPDADVTTEAVRRVLELSKDDRLKQLHSTVGVGGGFQGLMATVGNVQTFATDNYDAFLDRAIVLINDDRTREISRDLGASYQLFVFLVAAAPRELDKFLPRVRQASEQAKQLGELINTEAVRFAVVAADSPHEISVFFDRAKAAVAANKNANLAKKLGQTTNEFVLNAAAGEANLEDFFAEANQAAEAAEALGPITGMDEPELAQTALRSVYSPKSFAVRVEAAMACDGISDMAAKCDWDKAVCALIAGNSLLDPDEYLTQLDAALNEPELASLAAETNLTLAYLAVMAAESRRPAGAFFADVRAAMGSDEAKRLSEEGSILIQQAAVILAFAKAGD